MEDHEARLYALKTYIVALRVHKKMYLKPQFSREFCANPKLNYGNDLVFITTEKQPKMQKNYIFISVFVAHLLALPVATSPSTFLFPHSLEPKVFSQILRFTFDSRASM